MQNSMNKAENVASQYADDKKLLIRTRLHTMYSTNKQGLTPWLFEQYEFEEGDRILELGCGNGGQWNSKIDKLPRDASLILSDFSEEMVSIVRSKYEGFCNVGAESIDIQNIPYADTSFDVVIANFMLYHVPDIDKGIAEVRRVLKPGGVFYAATNGDGGMKAFLREAFLTNDPNSMAFTQKFPFSIQNGAEILTRHFNHVEYRDYPDSLEITNSTDLMNWVKSMISIETFPEEEATGLFDYFENIRQRDGAIRIPKECGIFISKK